MKVTTEDLGNRQVMLTIEVDEERVDRALRGVARRVSREYSIPGFRRGRAPFHIVVQRFGREALLNEALEDLGQEVIQEALVSENLEPYDVGSLEEVKLDPLVLKLRVPLPPVVDLGNYRELRVEPLVVTVEEEEVEDELARLRQANAILEPAGDRPAQLGDWVSLKVTADLGDESLVREDAYEMVLEANDREFELGFSEQVVGMKAAEEKQFTLTLSDDWGEEKTGQEAVFNVMLREIKSRTLPDLDDDLARTVGDYDTLEELRQGIREQFEEDSQQEADRQYADQVLEALVDAATIEYPPELIEHQVDHMAEDLVKRLEPRGLSLEDFFKLSGQTEEAFRESMRPQAEAIVRRGLALGELARREELDVEGREIDEHIALLSAGWGERAEEVREALSEPDSVRTITNRLLTDKVVQRLVAIARGEASPLEETDEERVKEAEIILVEAESVETEAPEPGIGATPVAAEEVPSREAGSPPETD